MTLASAMNQFPMDQLQNDDHWPSGDWVIIVFVNQYKGICDL
jgi:hypothetical protein